MTLLAQPLLPEGLHAPRLPVWNALFGAACGYRIVGSHAGQGIGAAMGRGVTAGCATALVALFLHSGARMIELSMRQRYAGLVEASTETFALLATYAAALADPRVIGAGLAGSALAGVLADAMQRRFT